MIKMWYVYIHIYVYTPTHTHLDMLTCIYICICVCVLSFSVVSDSAIPWLQLTRLFCPWDFPSKNTGVGCHFLPQGIFTTQRRNRCLLHCRQTLYPQWCSCLVLGICDPQWQEQEGGSRSPTSVLQVSCLKEGMAKGTRISWAATSSSANLSDCILCLRSTWWQIVESLGARTLNFI